MRSVWMFGLLWATPSAAMPLHPSFAEVPSGGVGAFRDVLLWENGRAGDSSRRRAMLPDLGQPYSVDVVSDDLIAVGGLEIGSDVTLRVVGQLAIAGRQATVIDNSGMLRIDADATSDGLIISEDTHLIGRGRLSVDRGTLMVVPGRLLTMYPSQHVSLSDTVSGHFESYADLLVPRGADAVLDQARFENHASIDVFGSLGLRDSSIVQNAGTTIDLAEGGSLYVDGVASSISGGVITGDRSARVRVIGSELSLDEVSIDRMITIEVDGGAAIELLPNVVLDGVIDLRDGMLTLGGDSLDVFGTGTITGSSAGSTGGSRIVGSARLAPGIQLRGSFQIEGDVAINGTLSPGIRESLIGVVRSDASLLLGPSSRVELDVSSAGRDSISIEDTLTIQDGASLRVTLPKATVPGEILTLLTAGEVVGSFGLVEVTNAEGLEVSLRYPSGRVELVLGYCRADANENGQLDASDFGAWLKAFHAQEQRADQNGDGLFDGRDYAAWLSNFEIGCD